MQNYLLTILIDEKIAEKNRQDLLASIIKDFGKLIKEDLWGVRSLSYPIKHQSSAFYAHFEFEAEPKAIPPLDKKLKLNEDIIRYLLLRPKVIKKQPKVSKKITKKIETEKAEEIVEVVA